MKILVTGGAGFIGSHVVDKLINKKYSVVIVDDISSGSRENINEKAKFWEVDITGDKLTEVFEEEKPDYVIHLAGQSNLRKSMEDPCYDAKINVLGSINVFNNCLKYKVKKVIFSSSGGARYGEPERNPCKEDSQLRPISIYGASKICAEKYLETLNRVYGLDYCILAIANVYGPRQNPKGEAGIVSIFCDSMLKDEKCVIFSDGEQTRDFIYVEDVVNIIILSLEKETKSKIFNVGSGKPNSVNQIFRKLSKLIGYNIPAVNKPLVNGEVKHIYLDINRLTRELLYEPSVDFDKGLLDTVNWYKEKNKKSSKD